MATVHEAAQKQSAACRQDAATAMCCVNLFPKSLRTLPGAPAAEWVRNSGLLCLKAVDNMLSGEKDGLEDLSRTLGPTTHSLAIGRRAEMDEVI